MSAVQTEREQRIQRARTHVEAAQPALLPALALERRRMLTERALRAQRAASIRNTNEPGLYTCPELTAPAVRLGADNHMALPSRVGKQLHYRDGRVELLAEGAP